MYHVKDNPQLAVHLTILLHNIEVKGRQTQIYSNFKSFNAQLAVDYYINTVVICQH